MQDPRDDHEKRLKKLEQDRDDIVESEKLLLRLERKRQAKVVINAIDDIRSMNVTVSVEHVNQYLNGDAIPAEIIERVVYLSTNPVGIVTNSLRSSAIE